MCGRIPPNLDTHMKLIEVQLFILILAVIIMGALIACSGCGTPHQQPQPEPTPKRLALIARLVEIRQASRPEPKHFTDAELLEVQNHVQKLVEKYNTK